MQSSPEQPVPVRTVARAIGDWVGRLGRVWVEGQITELTRRSGPARVFITLRDPVAEVSLQLSCSRAVLDAVQPPPGEGAHVVVQAKPEFYLNRGTLSLQVFEIRPVGAGALLARLEQLKQVLRAEGLFRTERKRPLPFLPRTVGLVTGRASAAERDVVENARRRWPAVQFRTRNVPVQGPNAVPEILSALRSLDADPEVDVIVLARGGGSVEDLLPFSDEGLCRAVADCRTPVVSAVGHEDDTPIVDFVADRRASTPTDAAKLLVPDVREERTRIADARARVARTVTSRVQRESQQAADARSRVRRCVRAALTMHAEQVSAARGRVRRCAVGAVQAAERDLVEQRARVRALSPAATLERGYAVLRTETGAVVRDPAEVTAGQSLTARLARGDLPVTAEPDRPRTR